MLIRSRWRRVTGIALATTAATTAAWSPTNFRLDVAALVAAALLGVVPALLAIVAGSVAVVVRSHDRWSDAIPFLIAVLASAGTSWVLRRPRSTTQLPSRSALRLLALVGGAAALGLLQHIMVGEQYPALTAGRITMTAMGLLCGMLLGTAFWWRPSRGAEVSAPFFAVLAGLTTVALVIGTVGFWQRQDEALLHSTVEASSLGFLTALADEMNVVTTKADTSLTEPFTAERFPSLMQTVVFGHDSLPAAQMVELTSAGPQVLGELSSLGGEFEQAFRVWTARRTTEMRAVADSGVITYLGLAALPRSTGGSNPYLVYGTPLHSPAGTATTHERFLVVAISIPALIHSSAAATLASTGEAVLQLYVHDADQYVTLWSTTGDAVADDTPDTFVAVDEPTDRRGTQALSALALNDVEFVFAASTGHDFGTPVGLRRLVAWLEVVAGLLVMGLVLVNGDHRARRDRERLRREALLSAALQGSPGWTAILDQGDRVVMSNDQPLGARPGERLANAALWDDDDDTAARVAGLVATARAGNAANMQYVWSDPDDASHAMRIFEIEARPLPDPTLVYLQCVDVTEHRDRAMRTAQSERMEAIGVLAGGLAHDFNNLLFITLGYLQMLERQQLVQNDAQAVLYVARAIEAVERGAAVAKSLLSFARSQPLTAVPVNLRQFIDELHPLIEQALGSAHTLEVHADGDDLDVIVDPGRLSSGLLNTVFNARDAMDGRGTLEIRIERCVAAPVGGDAVAAIAIAVRDTGRGMSPEVLDRAFEPFFTTKQVGSGTGLGLATVYSFAQQSGGWAAIESVEQVGTTVTVFLPPAVESPTFDLPARAPRTATRALVVDDEAALADLVAGWLEDLGMETRVATTPEQALRVQETFAPELLVSDANLGASMDGLELARILVQRDPALLVVFMTGFSERIRALQAAGVATLAKPFSRDDLFASLTTHLGDRLVGPHREGLRP